MRIDGTKVTTCAAAPDGETVRLDFVDAAGNPVSLHLPFDQAQALTMTLPQLLTFALKAKTDDESARFVFPLGSWRLENAAQSCLILTLATSDGFEVSFGLQPEDCWALAKALKADGEWSVDRAEASVN